MAQQNKIRNDLNRYMEATMSNNINAAVAIEQRYGLYGYPPDIVSRVLSAGAEGRNMMEEEDRAIGALDEGGCDEHGNDHCDICYPPPGD